MGKTFRGGVLHLDRVNCVPVKASRLPWPPAAPRVSRALREQHHSTATIRHATLTIGDAQAVFELRLDADFVEPVVDLRAAAVHQHRPDAHARQQHQILDHALLRIFGCVVSQVHRLIQQDMVKSDPSTQLRRYNRSPALLKSLVKLHRQAGRPQDHHAIQAKKVLNALVQICASANSP